MLVLYKNEWLKLRRQFLGLIIFIVPIIGVAVGTFSFISSYDLLVRDGNGWYELWTQVTFFYGLFILPIITGIYAAFVCRTEHQHDGWRYLFTLPISKHKLLLAKLFVILTILLVMQGIFLTAVVVIGTQVNNGSSIPVTFLLKSSFLGWLVLIPLAIIQLWMSLKIKSFAIALAINIFLTLGSLFTIVLKLEQYYPWAYPFIALGVPEEVGNDKTIMYSMVIAYIFVLLGIIQLRLKREEI